MAWILFEGRTVWWNGRKVIILEKLPFGRVKVAYANNSKMIRIVKREELY
ncbi:MAG: hypothetical protein IKZ00_06285 [Bacteroidaceae bacterium]|nr:hypothetical protein [Bacteroidaceae bacterium]